MTPREIVWTASALAELDELVAYIRRQDPVTAIRVAERIDDRVGALLAHPSIGRPGRVRGTRELVIAPFVVAYELTGDLIVILTILRGRRRWPRSFRRRGKGIRSK
ncbi:MAG: type II toxin-antitoxin system RelE/ParE family toxin [Reyranella sp.]|jgi:addiction module RelE/StbE family toxin|nr:type II toxin-antitoxin system RelE/ParE family toxin [Reyranella sp.]